MPHAEEQGSEVERRRQKPRRRAAAAVPIGTYEPERPVAAQGIVEAGPAAEVEKVGAAAHGHVLASIDEPAAHRILIRGRAAATPPPRFE
jgi:hypothetical protein